MRSLGLLAVATLLSATACGGGSSNDDSSAVSESAPVESESSSGEPLASESEAEPSLPQEAESEPDPEPEAFVFDTTELAARLQATIDELEFDDSSADLDDCPLGRFTPYVDLSEMIPEDLHSEIGLTASPSDFVSTARAFELPISGTVLVGCSSALVESGNGGGIDVALAPDSIDAYLREFNDPDSIGDVEFEITSTESYAGGEFLHVTVDTVEGTEFPFNSREVVWINDEVMVSAYVLGPAMVDVEFGRIEASLRTRLPFFIDFGFDFD